MQQHRVIGKSLPKVDGVDKVTGRSRFGADPRMRGTLHGKILRSPYAHARIKSIDTSRALALPGVKAVVTGADYPPVAPGDTAPMGGISLNMYDLGRVIIARDKVLYAGHPSPRSACSRVCLYLRQWAQAIPIAEGREASPCQGPGQPARQARRLPGKAV